MSPRPPPKISLRHEWTRELGSKVVRQPEGEAVQQPEGEVVRQTKFFQSTQPIPNPIRDRSGRPDDMQDERNTSFSQEINVNSFNEELSSSDRTGRLVEIEVIQTRSSEDSKSLNVEQTHDRTGRPVANTAAVQDDSQVCHEADTLNVDDEVLRKRMEKSFVVHDENHEPMMVNEADMDFRIPGLPHSRCETRAKYQRSTLDSENWEPPKSTCSSTRPTTESIILILSVQSQNKWFGMLGTSNYVNYSRRNPKRSAKYVYYTGTLASSIARVGSSCEKEEGRISNSSMRRWTFFQFRSTSSRKDDLTDIDMVKSRETGKTFRPTSWRRNARTSFFQGIHDRFIRDETFRNRMIENGRDEDVCRQWDALADEDHTHHILITRVIGGFIQTRQVPILCQWSTDLTSNKHSLLWSNWNKKKKELYKRPRTLAEINNGHRALLLLHGGVGKVHGGLLIPMKVTMEMNQVLMERWPVVHVFGTILQGMIFLNSITLLQMDRLQLTAVYCDRRRV